MAPTIITCADAVYSLVRRLIDARATIGLDVETRGVQLELRDMLIGVGLAHGTARYYIPLRHTEPMRPLFDADASAEHTQALTVWALERETLPPRLRRYPRKPAQPKRRTRDDMLADLAPWPDNVPPAEFWRAFYPLLQSQCCVITHNAPFDLRALCADACAHGYAFRLPIRRHDSLLMAYALSYHLAPGHRDSLELNALAEQLLGERKNTAALDTFFSDRAVRARSDRMGLLYCAPVAAVATYCCQDAALPPRLVAALWPAMRSDTGCQRLYRREMALVPVTMRLEMTGKHVDVTYVHDRCREGAHETARRLTHVRDIVGNAAFNPRSSPQLVAALLARGLALPLTDRCAQQIARYATRRAAVDAGETLMYSTNKTALAAHADDALVQALVAYRRIDKLIGTEFEGIRRGIVDGCIYPQYRQTTARTGRYSSVRPNGQNLSHARGDDDAWSVRRAITAPPQRGWYLLCADLSQIEPRLTAHMTRDPHLLRVYKQGLDVYVELGKTAWPHTAGITDDEWKARYGASGGKLALRKKAKNTWLAISYDAGADKMAQMLGIAVEEAAAILERLQRRYSTVWRYKAWLQDQYQKRGYVRNPAGRRLYPRHQSALYALFNAQIQSWAADFLKAWMVLVDKAVQDIGHHRVRMCMCVHDELDFYATADAVPMLVERVDACAQAVAASFSLRVPVRVEYGITAGAWSALREFRADAPIPW